jgi:hypothetical protein
LSEPSSTLLVPAPAQARRRLLREQRGVVYLEFLFAIFPVLIAFFGFTQLALIITARIVVQHAATRAARSAVVVLDDDPERYDGAPRGQIVYREQSNQQTPSVSAPGVMSQALNMGGGTSIGSQQSSSRGGARLNAIRTAAYMPLGAIAPSPDRLMRAFGMSSGSLGNLGAGARFLAGMLLYNRAAAVVTLRKEPGSKTVANVVPSRNFGVTVHVTYLYLCGMPFADLFLCDSALDLSGYGQVIGSVNTISDRLRSGDFIGAADEMGQIDDRLGAAQEQFESIQQELRYAEAPEFLIPFMVSSARFKVIEGEATMPNQGACYYEGSSCYGGASSNRTNP